MVSSNYSLYKPLHGNGDHSDETNDFPQVSGKPKCLMKGLSILQGIYQQTLMSGFAILHCM